MQTQKLSISLPKQLCEFIDDYQQQHCQTRSDVIKMAIYLLQQKQLEACYEEANQEIDSAFEITTSDGIEDDETW